MPSFDFDVALTSQQILSVYEGQTRFILVKTRDGLKLQLPAANFRKFVTNSGIHGRFKVTIDANNKIQELRKL